MHFSADLDVLHEREVRWTVLWLVYASFRSSAQASIVERGTIVDSDPRFKDERLEAKRVPLLALDGDF
jgi:hypothetical protein